MNVSQSIWQGQESAPKTKKSAAPVPVIHQLCERLEMHRLRQMNQKQGPMFPSTKGTPLNMNNVLNHQILPALNRCDICHKAEADHKTHPVKSNHQYVRDASLPEWHVGTHAGGAGNQSQSAGSF